MGSDLHENGCFPQKRVAAECFSLLFLKKWSFVGFQIGNERRDATTRTSREIRFCLHKEFRAAGIRFYLHKDCCAAGIRFHLHKDFRVAGIEFSLHKEFHKKNHEKSMVLYLKLFALRAPICKGIQRKYVVEVGTRSARAWLEVGICSICGTNADERNYQRDCRVWIPFAFLLLLSFLIFRCMTSSTNESTKFFPKADKLGI